MDLLTPDELASLRAFVSERYRHSGKPDDVVQALDDHNDRVLEHVDEIADGENLDTAERCLLQTIAVLHDVAKADTDLMLHHEVGARIAEEKLGEMGKGDEFIAAVQRGIECHMGPFPFVDEEARKYEKRTGKHVHLPRPDTKLDRLFYDADMLALMDIPGIEKIVVLRGSTPEFIREDHETATREGITPRAAAYRSAMESVRRAADTLHSHTAQEIARRLMDEADQHIARKLSAERSLTG